jgi:PAS domain S-box-containing protein
LIHRYGEWVMLMIGESILSLLIVETVESQDYYVIALVGVLTVILIQTLKFESEPSHSDGHALWTSMTASIIYTTLIQILSIGLIAFGVSFKIMLTLANKSATVAADCGEEDTAYGDDDQRLLAAADPCARRALAALPTITDNAAAALYCGSLTIVLVSLELMVTTHHDGFRGSWQFLFKEKVENEDRERWRWNIGMFLIAITKLALIIFIATLSQWRSDPRSIASAGFLVVTALACSRIMGWGIVHKEEEIKQFLGMSMTAAKTISDKAATVLSSIHSQDSGSLRGNNGYYNGIDEGAEGFEKAIWDTSFDGIVVIDDTGIIKHVNVTTLSIFGYDDAKELVGNNISILVGGGEANTNAAYVMNFNKGEKQPSIIGKQRVMHSRRKDGSEFPCSIGIKQLPRSTDLIGYIRNTTDLPQERQYGEDVVSDPTVLLVDDSSTMGGFDAMDRISPTSTTFSDPDLFPEGDALLNMFARVSEAFPFEEEGT